MLLYPDIVSERTQKGRFGEESGKTEGRKRTIKRRIGENDCGDSGTGTYDG